MSLPLLPHPQAVSSWRPPEGMGQPALVRGDKEVQPGREIKAFQKHWAGCAKLWEMQSEQQPPNAPL